MLHKNMKIKNKSMIKGRFKITTFIAGTNDIVSETDWINNLVVANSTGNGNGVNLIVKRLIGDLTTDLEITQAKIGTGDTAPTGADTDLETSVLDGILVASTSEEDDFTALISFFISDAELADGDYKEFGIFCGTQLFARALILPVFTKSSGQDIKIDYQITINN